MNTSFIATMRFLSKLGITAVPAVMPHSISVHVRPLHGWVAAYRDRMLCFQNTPHGVRECRVYDANLRIRHSIHQYRHPNLSPQYENPVKRAVLALSRQEKRAVVQLTPVGSTMLVAVTYLNRRLQRVHQVTVVNNLWTPSTDDDKLLIQGFLDDTCPVDILYDRFKEVFHQ